MTDLKRIALRTVLLLSVINTVNGRGKCIAYINEVNVMSSNPDEPNQFIEFDWHCSDADPNAAHYTLISIRPLDNVIDLYVPLKNSKTWPKGRQGQTKKKVTHNYLTVGSQNLTRGYPDVKKVNPDIW